MSEQASAKVYAKSIIQLGKEANIDIASELTTLTEVINSSNDLENVLFLDIFKIEEKKDVFAKISGLLKLSALVNNFVNFLIVEKRLGLLPLIYKEIVVLDDHEKGFLRGVVEGCEDNLDDAELSLVKNYLEKMLKKEVSLTYQKSDSVTAGLKVTAEDLQLDATIDNQFDRFKNSIIGE